MNAALADRTVEIIDYDGDELRIERTEQGALYLTASQEACTATVGPFTRKQLVDLLMGGI